MHIFLVAVRLQSEPNIRDQQSNLEYLMHIQIKPPKQNPIHKAILEAEREN